MGGVRFFQQQLRHNDRGINFIAEQIGLAAGHGLLQSSSVGQQHIDVVQQHAAVLKAGKGAGFD